MGRGFHGSQVVERSMEIEALPGETRPGYYTWLYEYYEV